MFLPQAHIFGKCVFCKRILFGKSVFYRCAFSANLSFEYSFLFLANLSHKLTFLANLSFTIAHFWRMCLSQSHFFFSPNNYIFYKLRRDRVNCFSFSFCFEESDGKRKCHQRGARVWRVSLVIVGFCSTEQSVRCRDLTSRCQVSVSHPLTAEAVGCIIKKIKGLCFRGEVKPRRLAAL